MDLSSDNMLKKKSRKSPYFPLEPNNNNNNNNNKKTKYSKYSIDDYTEFSIKPNEKFSGMASMKVKPSLYRAWSRLVKYKGELIQERMAQLLMADIEKLAEALQDRIIIQKNLIMVQPRIDITHRLQLKIVKKDLQIVVDHLTSDETKKRGDPRFWEARLKELLPKAMRIYEKTSDQDLEKLLMKTEELL